MSTTLDEAVREEFGEHVGLETWNDPTVAWDRRAIEHAADTIAWGLMDREMRMLAIGDPTRDELVVGFRILTGTDPLPKTDHFSTIDLPMRLEWPSTGTDDEPEDTPPPTRGPGPR